MPACIALQTSVYSSFFLNIFQFHTLSDKILYNSKVSLNTFIFSLVVVVVVVVLFILKKMFLEKYQNCFWKYHKMHLHFFLIFLWVSYHDYFWISQIF